MLVDLLVDRGQQRRAERGERVADAVFHRDERALQFGLVALNRDQHFSRFRLCGLRDGVRWLELRDFFSQWDHFFRTYALTDEKICDSL